MTKTHKFTQQNKIRLQSDRPTYSHSDTHTRELTLTSPLFLEIHQGVLGQMLEEN
jgi:hypothetical protein